MMACKFSTGHKAWHIFTGNGWHNFIEAWHNFAFLMAHFYRVIKYLTKFLKSMSKDANPRTGLRYVSLFFLFHP
jgi:hypothetical protein